MNNDEENDDRPRREDRPWDRGRSRRRDETDDEEDDEDDRPRRPRRRRPDPMDDPAMEFVIPLHTSGLAIAAGYVGLISVLCFPAPLALILGILALVQLKKKPKLHGRYRAVFAVVMGVIFSIPLPFFLYALVAGK